MRSSSSPGGDAGKANSKYSVVLLVPSVLLAVALAATDRTATVRRRPTGSLIDTAVAAIAALGLLLLTYGIANRNTSDDEHQRVLDQYIENEATLIVLDRLADQRALLEEVSTWSLGASQYLTGFLGIRTQNEIGVYPSYAFGTVSSRGRWWYFPVLAAVKLPLVMLVCLALFARGQWREWKRWPRPARGVLLSAFLIYAVVAVLSNYNIGFRHLLPILPLALLPIAATLAGGLRRLLIVLGALALESLIVAPLWISATNTWWLGENNPSRFVFSDGNLEYSQNFLTLARALASEPSVGILLPGKDTRTLAAYIPGAFAVPPGTTGLEPGLYAVSVLVEQYVPAVRRSDPAHVHGHAPLVDLMTALERTWREIETGEDLGYIAGTFHLYRLPARQARTPGEPPS